MKNTNTFYNKQCLFPFSFNVVRRNSTFKEAINTNQAKIFLAEENEEFKLYNNTDYSNIFIHPKNKSKTKKTILSQAITEGIVMAKEILKENMTQTALSHFEANEDFSIIDAEIKIPQSFDEIYYKKNEEIKTPKDSAEENTVKAKITINLMEEHIYITFFDENNTLLHFEDLDVRVKGMMDCNEKNFHFHDFNMLHFIFCTFTLASTFSNPLIQDKFLTYYNDENNIEGRKEALIELSETLYQENKDLKLITAYSFKETLKPNNNNNLISPEANNNFIEQIKNVKTKSNNYIFQLPEKIEFDESEFNEEQLSYIPKLAKEFKLPEEFEAIASGIYTGDVISLLFEGPAGTGKTAICKLLCQKIQLPIMQVINCNESLDESILGKYIPVNDKIVFYESNIVKAIKYGGAIVFEEINFAKPQHLAFLNSLLDDNGLITLDNGEVIKRHKNFRFMATMNYGYAGTRELNEATQSRFNYQATVAELPAYAIKNMLQTRIPESKPILNKVLTVYQKIKSYLNANECEGTINPRHLESWLKTSRYEGILKASEHTIVTACSRNDEDIKQAIRKIINLHFKQ